MARDDDDKPLPTRADTTATDLQRHALAKLLKDPSKPVFIPDAPSGLKQLRAPRETMKNVQGSSAGAGSGEFHVYKQSRRREYERLKIMDLEETAEKEEREALERQSAREAEAEERGKKNKAKRDRKKKARKGAAKKGSGEEESYDEGDPAAAGGGKKRRLANGDAAVQFKSAHERGYEDGSSSSARAPIPERAEPIATAREAGIAIRDED